MANDYAIKERAFVESLAADSGRSLGDWMQAITDSGSATRNEKIDWLRHQGFVFSKASWLERIHHNGGALIYADVPIMAGHHETAQAKAAEPVIQAAVQARVQAVVAINEADIAEPVALVASAAGRSFATPAWTPPVQSQDIVPAQPEPRTSATIMRLARPPLPPDVIELLAAAKGLKPLAELIVRDVQRRVANCEILAQDPVILMSAPTPFLAIWPSAKRIRLFGTFTGYGDLTSPTPADATAQLPIRFPHMLQLDDARRIDETFAALVQDAARAAGIAPR